MKHIKNNYKHVTEEGHLGKVFMETLNDKQNVAIKKSIELEDESKMEFIE